MRTYDDTFSGEKIYPGKGKLYVRGDSKIFRFQNGKTESLFLQRKNPRRIAWTVLFRRQHKKGISEHHLAYTSTKLVLTVSNIQEVAKKRSRRTVKQQRGIVGASLDVIKERRTQRPAEREAARKAAIEKGKEQKKESESKKKQDKAKSAKSAAQGQPGRIQSKMGAKGPASKVSAKSR
ncbi:60S ribosomal protein L24 [Bacidia gigantensis]|uniref:60S ribosomal protein L24 n=1 Tax=Bacidia gigantensis TaxID=2732470 RepID=UPI001D048540|nr:60S ribosomal protein L24 [Bacidia gigantensis]KAG8528682.1 60S ribosomal protein L24 [Bacidia gigantensis]